MSSDVSKTEGFSISNGILTGYNGPGGVVVVPEGVICIGEYAFKSNTEITGIYLPESLKDIRKRAFADCKSLQNIDLPNGLRSIGREAFSYTGINEVVIPQSVTEFGEGCFYGCDDLTITVFDSMDACPGTAGYSRDIFTQNRTCMRHRIAVKSSVTDKIRYIIYMGKENGTTGKYREIIINGWNEHGGFDFKVYPDAFASLKDADEKREVAELRLRYPVELSDEEKGIYLAYLKRGIKKYLTECAVANDYDRIQFYNDLGLVQAASIDPAIEESTKNGNTEMTVFLMGIKGNGQVSKRTPVKAPGIRTEDVWQTHRERTNLVTRYRGSEHEVVFPKTVKGNVITGIADATAKLPENYTEITSVVIPEGYTVIGDNAFNGCALLKNVELPSTLESIGKNAFRNCNQLRSIQLPESLKEIGDNAFEGSGINEFVFHSNVIIGDWALGNAEILVSEGAFAGSIQNNHWIGHDLKYVYSDGDVTGTGIPADTIMPLSYRGIRTDDLVKERNSILEGKKVCSLGKLRGLPKGIRWFRRIQFDELIERCGGVPQDRFGKDTDILVVQEVDPDIPTVQKAKGQGTAVMSELEFLTMIQGQLCY